MTVTRTLALLALLAATPAWGQGVIQTEPPQIVQGQLEIRNLTGESLPQSLLELGPGGKLCGPAQVRGEHGVVFQMPAGECVSNPN